LLRSRRKEKGLTIKDVAEMSNLSEGFFVKGDGITKSRTPKQMKSFYNAIKGFYPVYRGLGVNLWAKSVPQ
jgi:transcriptional regulator with XRE-family HTH domain